MNTSQHVAKALLDIKAVGFNFQNPIRFKSGILSPVYVDNRKFPFFPAEWKIVIKGFAELIKKEGIAFDCVAGIETAGIPHSAALGFYLDKPSAFIRKAAKDHGTKKMVEGGDIKGKATLLIEDHVSTGGSSLHGVNVIQQEGGSLPACLAITSYGWEEAVEAFEKVDVKLFTLTSFPVILEEAVKRKLISSGESHIVGEWLADPHGWGKRQGLE